ncbi:MAG: hypothetical protein ACQESF_00070 [Nanobdellota archaeon]
MQKKAENLMDNFEVQTNNWCGCKDLLEEILDSYNSANKQETFCQANNLKGNGLYRSLDPLYDASGLGYDKTGKPLCPIHKTPMNVFGMYATKEGDFDILGCSRGSCGEKYFRKNSYKK